MSVGEAEYIASSVAGRELMWMHIFFSELGFPQTSLSEMRLDSTSVLKWNNNPTNSSRTKHIDLAFNFTRHEVVHGNVITKYVEGREQIADILTKNLPHALHEKFVLCLGLVRARVGVLFERTQDGV
jgi:hypothetical protein